MSFKDRAVRLRNRMSHRSRKKGHGKVEWTTQEIRDIIKDGHCEITGIKFRESDEWMSPYQASPDRIDCSKGYTKQNTRWVCLWINNALNSWGDTVLHKFVGYINESNSRHRDKRVKPKQDLGGRRKRGRKR